MYRKKIIDGTYTDVQYSDLNVWISENIKEAGEYNINVIDVPAQYLGGHLGDGGVASPFATMFNSVIEGAMINLKFSVNEDNYTYTSFENCFYNTKCLKTLVLPNFKYSYGFNSFLNGCDNLEMVVLPENVFVINDYNSFAARTSKLKKVYVKDQISLDRIESWKNKDGSGGLNYDKKVYIDRDLYLDYDKVYDYIVTSKDSPIIENSYTNIADDSKRFNGLTTDDFWKKSDEVIAENAKKLGNYNAEEIVPGANKIYAVSTLENSYEEKEALPHVDYGYKWQKIGNIKFFKGDDN